MITQAERALELLIQDIQCNGGSENMHENAQFKQEYIDQTDQQEKRIQRLRQF